MQDSTALGDVQHHENMRKFHELYDAPAHIKFRDEGKTDYDFAADCLKQVLAELLKMTNAADEYDETMRAEEIMRSL